MELREWFNERQEILLNKLLSRMANSFGEHCTLTGGRANTATYCITFGDGLSFLRSEIILMISETFEMYPKNRENIEVTKTETIVILNKCLDKMFGEYQNKYLIGRDQSRNLIAEIELDIAKLTELHLCQIAERRKNKREEAKWKFATIIISAAALIISILSFLNTIFDLFGKGSQP